MLSFFDIGLLIVYALVCLGIGFYGSRRQGGEEFMIAGRKLNLVGFTASVVASYIGGAALMAYAAYVYQFGISALAVFLGTAAGFLVFIPYALRLRRISEEKKFHTLSDWFYHNYSPRVGLLSALILFVVYLGMLLNQFIAGSSILASISGWSYEESLTFSSGIILVYLLAGGFNSVIRTDIFQYIVLFVLFILLGFILASDQPGMATEYLDLGRMDLGMTIAFIAFGIFIIFQSAEYWQRVYAARNASVVKQGLIWSAVLVLLTGLVITVVGLAAHHGLPGLEPREAFAGGLKLLMPRSFLGAGLVLIFAAIMSSADTIIFVLASSLAKDYHTTFGKAEVSPDRMMRSTRLFILLLSLAGYALAWFFRDLVAVIV
ncbi:MAG TPA: sodium:solute symporter family protein, partial [Bacteroidales bacterium]|nr:sodium:solute symporter family protein [Bacteroidales bacterium]